MTILTTLYVGAVVYANLSYNTDSSNYGKKPIEYGIWKAYFGEKLETNPQEWNTTEELGITFGKQMEAAEKEKYEVLILEPEKALSWMNGTVPEPYAVKYGDNFYRIVFLWVTPELPESTKNWQIPVGAALGAGWVYTGTLFLKGRKKKANC